MMQLGFSDQRVAVAAVLTTVSTPDGGHVTGYPYPPTTPAQWDAWPVLVDARPFTQCMSENDWSVFLALPGADAQSLGMAGDIMADPVCEALVQVGKVTHIRPARWQLADGGEIPGWQFEMTI